MGQTKVIDVFISALRARLGSTPERSIIRTVRGVGLHRARMSASGGAPAANAVPARLGSIRIRLTAWFLLAMAVLVAAGSIATYLIVSDRLHADARSGALVLARAARRGGGAGRGGARQTGRAGGPGLAHRCAPGAVLAGTLGATEATRGADARRPSRGTHADVTADGDRGERRSRRSSARSTAGLDSTLRTLRLALIVVGLARSAGVGGRRMGARIARAASRWTGCARRWTRSPGRRSGGGCAAERPDELGLLAAAFNRLLARAEVAAREQESFVADASHELKTPITALEGHARVVVRAIDRSRSAAGARVGRDRAPRVASARGHAPRAARACPRPVGAPASPRPVRLDLAVRGGVQRDAALEPGAASWTSRISHPRSSAESTAACASWR